MMLSEGTKETPPGDLLVADGFDAVFIEPTSTPVTQITYDAGTTYVSDTSSGRIVHSSNRKTPYHLLCSEECWF
jgi:hypothetical protein